METISVERSLATSETSPDPAWRSLYRVGSIAAALFVLLVIIPLVLLVAVPQPPLEGGAAILQYIASHRTVYLVELMSFVGLSLPAMVVFLALYVALRHLSRSIAALGALIGIASEVIALAFNSSPPSLSSGLLYLSDHYMAATTAVQRTTYATAAEGLAALSNGISSAGILTALSILIFSLIMLKGVFQRNIAFLGIVTGVLGLISEPLRDVLGPGYAVYGLLLPTWFAMVGWKLYQLGWHNS